jgi:thioredoxin 1
MADIVDVTDGTFESEVLKSDQPVIVDFWAEWCAPCRAIAPIMKDLAGTYDGKAKIVKVNVDDSPQTAGAYGIRSIPTVLAFHDGQVVEQLMGARPKSAFVEMLDKLV